MVLGGLFGLFQSQNLPHPGKFEEINLEAKSVLSVGSEIFQGGKIELMKVVTPQFQLSHSLAFGSTVTPATYDLSATYATQKVVLASRLGHTGDLQARCNFVLTPRLQMRLSPQLVSKPHESSLMAEIDYKGDDFSAQFKMGNASIYGLSYLQSVTPTLALGSEIMHAGRRGMTVATYAARYSSENSVGTLQYMSHDASTTLSYTQRVNDKVNLATELTVIPSQRASVMTFGYEVRLRQSALKAMIDSSGTVSASIEEMLQHGPVIQILADLNHKKRDYKFGIGLQLGGR